jgi:hypothetical protein
MNMVIFKQAGGSKKQYHYFVSCAICWAADNTLTGAIAKVRKMLKEDGRKKMHVLIFKVPGSSESSYEINFFCPQVKGSILISTEDFVV